MGTDFHDVVQLHARRCLGVSYHNTPEESDH